MKAQRKSVTKLEGPLEETELSKTLVSRSQGGCTAQEQSQQNLPKSKSAVTQSRAVNVLPGP
jgi:hypothetical protein